MRRFGFLALLVASLIISASPAFAQNRPQLHDINGFMVKGIFSELDPALIQHRLSLREIEKAKLNSESTDIQEVVDLMAKYEKLSSHVEEPLEVRGKLPVFLPPNTMGDEAYTACFYAFNGNGLGLSGVGGELVVVRPEKHPALPRPIGTWNRDQILSTRLFRLGYLKPDPILRQYRDKAGSSVGHAVLEPKSNVAIVTDTRQVLDSLRAHIDSEILEAMGVPATDGQSPVERRPPSLGAIASRESIHFYLLAFARWSRIPLAAAQEPGVLAKHYPEADLWTSEQGYQALTTEYQRINEFVQLARETGGPGWDEANLDRTLPPRTQKRLAIRFGLASTVPGKADGQKSKKAARKR
jgi:hypothetical protein